MSSATLDTRNEKKIRDAEDLLFTGPQRLGVAKALFFGRFVADWVTPYPVMPLEQQRKLDAVMPNLRQFLDEKLDPAAIDRAAEIPRDVIDGLAGLGVLGMTAPEEFGGLGFSQMAYGQVLQEIGGRCASTSVFVNAHHSIGIRGLLLFGTPEQQRRWLPPLVRGQQLAAFALTEPEAGSDAANVQTTATLSADGTHYLLNGEKRYITNAAIAQVLNVMARVPAAEGKGSSVAAFLVTPDMPGFKIVEGRMSKLGIRGTATARLAFENMPVPTENMLGGPAQGLKVALTVLDYGRTTFGACCTGAAKTCLRLATHHARTRRQFGRTLGEFELVKKKIALMAAATYAMEATTVVTASLIDRGLEDYMLETAMLKVFTTEALWQIVNDAFQIHGGAAYFTDLPLERMLRDARINQIGEGANEVLISFIALVGMRGPGLQFKEIWDALHQPGASEFRSAWRVGLDRLGAAMHPPAVPVRNTVVDSYGQQLARMIWRFNLAVDQALIRYREGILDREYVQERIARVAMELYASACVLSRWDAEVSSGAATGEAGRASLYLRGAFRRMRRYLAALRDNDDLALTAVADEALHASSCQS